MKLLLSKISAILPEAAPQVQELGVLGKLVNPCGKEGRGAIGTTMPFRKIVLGTRSISLNGPFGG